MKEFTKKLTALFLAFTLMLSIMPVNAFMSYAETLNSSEVKTDTSTLTNPAYEGLDIKTYSPKPHILYSADQTFDTIEEAGEYLKKQMIDRNGTIEFTINQEYYKGLSKEIFNEAVEDNGYGDSSAGDYLYWNWGGYEASASYITNSNSTTLTYTMNYLSTYSQEQQVNQEVKNVLDELDVYDQDNYHKVLAVHDYIVQNIEYDYSLENHSGYNAIVDKNVVCQGFASITCKMLKELNVGVRLISGTGNGGAHGWNIIKLGNYWYNTDNTWDENTTGSSISYKYFLKGSNYFDDHTRDSEYDTSEFHSLFPTSASNYVYSASSQKSIASATVKVNDQTYTGSALTPYVSVSLNGTTLTKGTDYTVFYSNNTNVGTATVTITGINNYYGTATANFEIVAPTIGSISQIICTSKDSSSATISWSSSQNATGYQVYRSTEGGSYSLVATTSSLSYKDTSLSPNTTYYYIVRGYKTVGSKTFYGNYSDTLAVTTNTIATSIASATVTVNDTIYTGAALTPSVSVTLNGTTLIKNTDYTLAYSNNTNIGTATVTVTGINDYTGTVTANFKILAPTIGTVPKISCTSKGANSATISWSSAQNANKYQLYRASSENGTYSLVSTADSLSYTDSSLSANTTYYYKVRGYKTIGTQTFYGDYSDILSVTTNATAISIASATVTVDNQTFTGNALTPSVSVTLDGTTLAKDTDYTVSYSNNTNVGTATVTITGINNYTGTVTANFKILAPTVGTVSEINCTSKESNSATISWSSAQNATGYKLYRASSIDGTYALVATTKSNSYTDSELNSNTTYYYKVRAYKTVASQNFYGDFSDILSITTKVAAKSISSAEIELLDQTYTGSALTPSVSVYLNGITLNKGTDYTISYSNNINIGTATVTITGINNYTGTITAHFEILPPRIDPVEGLIVENSDSDSIQISWDPIDKTVYYEIYRSTEKYGDYELVADINSATFTDSELEPNTTYYYKVKAYKVIDSTTYYGSFSSIIMCTTKPAASTLSISDYNYPTKIVRGNSFTLKGTITSNYLIDKVNVQVLDANGVEVPSVCKTVYPNDYSFDNLDTGIKFGLLNTGSYTYKVTASDESGVEKVLIQKNFTVTAPYVSVKSITGLKYTSTTSSTTLSWTKPSSGTGYEVWMYKSSLGYYTRVKTITSRSTNYYKRTGLTSATMYRYKVRAYRVVNGKKYYGKFTDEFITATKPLTPSITLSSTQKGKIKITWSNISKKTTGYQIYRATSRYGTYTRVATVEDGNIARSYTNSGRTSGKTYYYKVRAYRTLDNGKKVYSSYSSVKYKKAK